MSRLHDPNNTHGHCVFILSNGSGVRVRYALVGVVATVDVVIVGNVGG